MANEPTYKDFIKAYPTHILIPDEDGEEERVMYANCGEVFFIDGFQPERGKSYRLVSNAIYEEFSARNKATE